MQGGQKEVYDFCSSESNAHPKEPFDIVITYYVVKKWACLAFGYF